MYKKIKNEDLSKIINFIGSNTTTNVGYPLIEMIKNSISDCECSLTDKEDTSNEHTKSDNI